MRFYEIDDTHSRLYAPTLADAQRRARETEPEKGPVFSRFDVQIREVEVPTDKDGVLSLLNHPPEELGFKVLRTWEITPRGGLKEVDAKASAQL